MNLADAPLWIIAFLISSSFHEFMHAWTAYKLGDDTAARHGRLTLNPIPHIDPVGLVFLVITALSGFGIGWAKPVPVNPNNFRHPRRDNMLVALSGPVANIILGMFFVLLWKLFPSLYDPHNPVSRLMDTFLFLNVILAAFNLIPIFPLDGSHIVEGILPENLADKWTMTYRFGFIVLLILMVTGGLHVILMPFVSFVTMLIGAPFLLGR